MRQGRFCDFNVWSRKKQSEKLNYMHQNPVKRRLVREAEQWEWSSFRGYAYGEAGQVRVNAQEWGCMVKKTAAATNAVACARPFAQDAKEPALSLSKGRGTPR